MGTPHKHAKLIKKWADGADVQVFSGTEWFDLNGDISFYECNEYRIKPEPKGDVIKYMGLANHHGDCAYMDESFDVIDHWRHQLKLTFDGETGKLKSVEIIK